MLRDLLTHREGIYNEYANKVAFLEKIYDIRIPSGRVMSPDSERIFKMELWTKLADVAIQAGAAGAGPGGTNEDFISYATVLAGAGGAPLLPYKANGVRYVLGEEVRIVLEVTAGAGTAGDVLAIATCTTAVGWGLAGADGVDYDIGEKVTVYYRPTIAGLFILEYGRSDMLGVDARSIFSTDTVTMMLNNPFHRDQFKPFRAPTVWPSQWVLQMKLNAPWVVAWEDNLGGLHVPLPEWHIPVIMESRNNYDAGLEDRVVQSLIRVT